MSLWNQTSHLLLRYNNVTGKGQIFHFNVERQARSRSHWQLIRVSPKPNRMNSSNSEVARIIFLESMSSYLAIVGPRLLGPWATRPRGIAGYTPNSAHYGWYHMRVALQSWVSVTGSPCDSYRHCLSEDSATAPTHFLSTKYFPKAPPTNTISILLWAVTVSEFWGPYQNHSITETLNSGLLRLKFPGLICTSPVFLLWRPWDV